MHKFEKYSMQRLKSLTKAVNSCGLDISLGTIEDGFVDEFGLFCLTEGVGVLSLSASPNFDGVAVTFNGSADEGIGIC